MGILTTLKTFILANVQNAGNIYFNFQPDITENCIILWQYDGIQSSVGLRPQVQISVKNKNMQTAETLIMAIYNAIYPKGQYEKTIRMGQETLKIVPRQSPFYLEKDENDRHIYVFNIDILQKRS